MSLTVLDKGALDKGVDQLILSDPSLKPLFDAYDVPELKIEKNYFWALCRSIIYQQISGKAASTIANRFLELFSSGKNIKANRYYRDKYRKTSFSWACLNKKPVTLKI